MNRETGRAAGRRGARFAGLLGLAVTVVVLAPNAAEAACEGMTPRQCYDYLDANDDGCIQIWEALNPAFFEMDTNHDWCVTWEEYVAWLIEQAIEELDTNGDGVVSQEEFKQLYCDYERYYDSRQAGAQPPAGASLLPVVPEPDPLGLGFGQDFFPGTPDPLGRVIEATEGGHLVAHDGQLFAGLGSDYCSEDPPPGYSVYPVIRKASAGGPWQVDLDFGGTPTRVEKMVSAVLETDADGTALVPPVNLLVASIWSPGKILRVRDDETGNWIESEVSSQPDLPPYWWFAARALGTHVDRDTGIASLFAGSWMQSYFDVGSYNGYIFAAQYDRTAPGRLRWAPAAELQDTGRVVGFAEANGDLYASCAIHRDPPNKGGIFRRLDGPQPSWELVYRWDEFDEIGWDDEGRMMRGLTAVPDPLGGGHQVLIGFRYYPRPVIERIDPLRDNQVTVELDLGQYFGAAWFSAGTYQGPIRAAYNGFVPVTDSCTGETVHVTGVQIYHPLFPEQPHNGSFYLVRHPDGTYDHGEIYDPAHPVPTDRALDATRVIAASPFREEQEHRTLYFGGYDGAFVDNRTAWIYRAGTPGPGTPPAEVQEFRVARAGADLLFTWDAVTLDAATCAETMGTYEVWRALRPDFSDGTSWQGTTDASTSLLVPGEGTPLGSGLDFYLVRARDAAGNLGE
jgi:hypothetical protein